MGLLIFYFIGVILGGIFAKRITIKCNTKCGIDIMDADDLLFIIYCSIFSWISVLVLIPFLRDNKHS